MNTEFHSRIDYQSLIIEVGQKSTYDPHGLGGVVRNAQGWQLFHRVS